MKKKLLWGAGLTLLLLLLATLSCSAGTYGDLTYSISGSEVTITDCNTSATGHMEIPKKIAGKPVTTIGYRAFEDCTGLTSVTIPDSVTTIGGYAFRNCTGLTSVTIPDSVTTIGDCAFYGCRGLTQINWNAKNVADFSSESYIFFDAGQDGEGIQVIFGETVERIPACAFYPSSSSYAPKITSVTIGNGVTTIGSYAFEDCTGLTSVTIPDSVTTIGKYAFSGCTGLTSVTIGSGVTTIESQAFYGCDGLTSVTIGSGVTTIGGYAFSGCTGLTSITIPISVTTIGSSAFRGCDGLTSVTMGNGVTTIGSYAFSGCTGLTSISIPSSVTTIGSDAFYGCDGLTSITIPISVITIGSSAFSGCTGLTSVTIPSSVTTIGDYAFSRCTGLTQINWNAKTVADFSSGNHVFAYAGQDGEGIQVIFGETVEKIPAYAFYPSSGSDYAPKITSVTIPDSVTTIGSSAFYNCDGLSSVTIPDSVTTIGSSAFYDCNGLTSLTVGKGMERIPEGAFYSCSNLKYVSLPAEVKYIRNDAFNGCSALEIVFYAGSQAQWNEILFYNRNENLTNADIIFNAVKKTYSFVTNCNTVLPAVTDYAVFTVPILKKDGATMSGWYDNAALTGTPISFPYYGNKTTLYAAWTDRTGTSFADAFAARANQTYSVTITEAGQLIYFEFVPAISKEYRFYTTGSKDTYGYLYNSNKSQIASNDNGGDGNNFRISYNLTAGNTYYIAVKLYSGTGTFTLVAEEPVAYTINSIAIKDVSGNAITQIPRDTFLATVSFTNVSTNGDAVIVLAQYTADGSFTGLMYVNTEDMPKGTTMNLTLPVDNKKGNITKLKAFLRPSLGSLTPIGNTVTFPAE